MFDHVLETFDSFEKDEELGELNAQLEDLILFMDMPDDEDGDEDILDDLNGLLMDYRELAERRTDLRDAVDAFAAAILRYANR